MPASYWPATRAPLRFSHNDATQYPKIAAAVDSGEMTEEEAATKIQALIRGRSVRGRCTQQPGGGGTALPVTWEGRARGGISRACAYAGHLVRAPGIL